ncbi:MAG TPA: tetratricopeptide repeat protein [Verrucomicrobiae bacterium]|jgi:tetratricopeptide (TPR) repeat protein|nr:tetratricopeptide repeat protein [Verrucomicrobiae bacterium]
MGHPFESWQHFFCALRLPLSSLFLIIFPFSAFALTPKQLLDAGRVDDAIVSLQQQISQNPKDASAYNLLCRAYFEMDDWDQGIPNCERARDLDPTSSTYELWLGRIYGEKADHVMFLSAAALAKKVHAAFEHAVELDPKNADARTDLAEFYLEAPAIVGGGKDKAHQQADALMALNPGMAHWIQARIDEKNKDSQAADTEYRAAIIASHSAAREWFDYAAFLRHAGRMGEMEEALRHLETAPLDRRESLMDGAGLLFKTQIDTPLAVRLLRRYLSDPVEEGAAFKAHALMGELLERQGDKKAAAEEFHASLALAHNYKRAQEDLQQLDH